MPKTSSFKVSQKDEFFESDSHLVDNTVRNNKTKVGTSSYLRDGPEPILNVMAPKNRPLPLKYNPPLYCKPEFQALSFQEKFDTMLAHHRMLEKKIHQMHRKSIFPAPWGKPITPTNGNFNGTLVKISQNIFAPEDDDDDDNIESSNSTPNSKPLDKMKRKMFDDEIEVSNKKQKTPDIGSHKKLTNAEIMRRSKLFSSSPDRPKTSEHVKTRSDLCFEKLVKQEEQKLKEKQAEESFRKTLHALDEEDSQPLDQESDEDFLPSQNLQAEEPVKRRILPPRRKMGSKKNEVNSEIIQDKERDHVEKCPICDKVFVMSVIQKHAATCGVPSIDVGSISRTSKKDSGDKPKCVLCNKTFEAQYVYEIHIASCTGKS